MKVIFRTQSGVLIIMCCLLSSCVSNKKHLAEVSSLKTNYEEQLGRLNEQLNAARSRIDTFVLNLAERKGENNALLAMQDKLESRIKELEEEIENQSSSAFTRQESLGVTLQRKEAELAEKEQLLKDVIAILDQRKIRMDHLAAELRDSLFAIDSVGFAIESRNGRAVIDLFEKFLFRPGSATRMNAKGLKALEKISGILLRYPDMTLVVTGHTDNRGPSNKSYKDNWNFSVLRAATVVRIMTKEFDLSTSQVLAAGKGEFAPRASNETSEGRSANRRMELTIQPKIDDLVKEIERKVK